ncbi:phage portal protein [Paenibacillus larvae]|nr:phage portal protein [Paenibacillus larvae]MDT2239100.1 phage portal protein [Paenibacillus larvae]
MILPASAVSFLVHDHVWSCFVLLPVLPRKHALYDLRVRLIEADRCNNPATGQIDKDIKEGVEVDSDGQDTQYWFGSRHPLASGGMGKMEWNRVEALGKRTGRRTCCI